jgi:GT2 family glycosyltransferase
LTAAIDVVIATRDRYEPLRVCLDALGRQTFDRFQVIIADDGSRHPVAAQLPVEQIGVGPAHVVRSDSSVGSATSRNRGIAEGTAPYVLFLDDDSVPHPELVARHVKVLSKTPGSVASFGPILPPPDNRLEPWNLWEADRLGREYSKLRRGEIEPSWMHIYAGNLAVHRANLEAVGGFDESFARQEDIELGLRLSRAGCRFVFEPSAVVWHNTHRSLERWLGIPVASAYYDLQIEKSSSQIDGLRFVEERLRQKHWLLRLSRRACAHRWLSQSAVRVAVQLGRALHVAGLENQSLMAFSLVWDLQYSSALRRFRSVV